MVNRIVGPGLAFVLLLGTAAVALEFSADVVTTAKGQAINSKMNYAGDKWRQETTVGGRRSVSIVRSDKKLVWLLLPEQKLYMEQKLQPEQERGMTGKPAGEVSRRKLGREKINGVDCDKYEVSYKSGRKTEKMLLWLSADNWPVKSAAVDNSWTTEFRNMKKGDQPDELFNVPAGYSKMSLPSMRLPRGVNPSRLYQNMKELPNQD